MLWKRICAAIPVLVILSGILYYEARTGSGWYLAGLQAVLCTLALREFYRMARTRGWRPFSTFGYVLTILFFFGHEQWALEKWHDAPPLIPQIPDILSVLITIAVLGSFLMQIFRKNHAGAMGNIASTLLGITYCWFLISFVTRIRHLGLPTSELKLGWQYDGIEFVFLSLMVAKASDVGGILVGSKLGKHKLCPNLSPKKTWEGLFGGILMSIAVLFLFTHLAPGSTMLSLGWAKLLGMAVLMAITSLLGDLVESALKRDSEMKDAGGSLPGYGGILDLLDSLMVAAPAAYFYLILVCGAKQGWEPMAP